MAKKINPNAAREASSIKTDLYPWLRLLDLDIQRSERPTAPRGKGRPRNPFPRQAVHITLTNEELAALDALVEMVSEGMQAGVHRGNMIAFMAFRLLEQLKKKEKAAQLQKVKSFTSLASLLDEKKENDA
jgi:hypothetical protein